MKYRNPEYPIRAPSLAVSDLERALAALDCAFDSEIDRRFAIFVSASSSERERYFERGLRHLRQTHAAARSIINRVFSDDMCQKKPIDAGAPEAER